MSKPLLSAVVSEIFGDCRNDMALDAGASSKELPKFVLGVAGYARPKYIGMRLMASAGKK